MNRPANSKFICVQSSYSPAKEYTWQDRAQHIHFEIQKLNHKKTKHMERTAINKALQLIRDEIGKPDKDLPTLYASMLELLEIERQQIEQAYRWGFTDGTRYTNGAQPFYTTANHYFTNNHLQ